MASQPTLLLSALSPKRKTKRKEERETGAGGERVACQPLAVVFLAATICNQELYLSSSSSVPPSSHPPFHAPHYEFPLPFAHSKRSEERRAREIHSRGAKGKKRREEGD